MSYLTHINRHDDLNYNEDFEEAIARNIKEEDFENNDSETEGSNSRTDTEDASETEEPPHKIQEEPVEIKEQIYQDKLANLKKQLEEVHAGSHPELIRRLKQLERQYHDRLRLNSYYRDYLIECVEKDYILEKNAAVKEYEEKKADLKENLLADFEDKKKMIESERTSMEIIESGEMRQTITRKLRRRPNDPVPVTEKRRKMGNGPASSLVFQLDDKEIEYDLKLISRGKSIINNNNNSNNNNNNNSMRNYSQNSSLMNNSIGNSNNIMVGYNNDGHAVETRIEDGKLLYERRWYHRGQAVYIEGTDVSRFAANISAIVGNDVIMVKRAHDGSKFRIYLHQLSSGKISIKRRN
ncbi:sin3 histone deacetylase corepressor complex component SDS3 isoform X1 [Chironomus tepperi]|uniref:sin3 histone deacetylase corepressor complex component SDS3 isoform X1 n=1 Tax=Chironomus tepperi TaxID=113505 RepID=UPI00391FADE6